MNPKIIVFFITFLPQFVSPTDTEAAPKLMVLGVLFVLIATPIVIAMILCAERLAAVLRRSRVLSRGVDWLFAVVLGGFAVKRLLARA